MAPSFRFLPAEVAEMEALANQLHGAPIPSRAVLQSLADWFSASPDRAGNNNIAVDPVLILIWFKNRRRRHPQAKRPRYRTAPLQTPLPESHQMHTADSSAPPSPAA